MTTETWYRKVGKRYKPVLEAEHYSYTLEKDGFVLTYREDGMTRYTRDITPDTVAFDAAAVIARVAMEEAISQAATYRPQGSTLFTEKQLAAIKKFKRVMGMQYPSWWQEASNREIAQAGIDAVKNYQGTKK